MEDYGSYNSEIINYLLCLKGTNWFELWIQKSDYIEEYYKRIKGKYRIIDESINYYIGMMELAINYIKKYNKDIDYVYVQYEVLVIENDLKYLFFEKEYNNDLVYNFLKKNTNEFNYELIVAVLLFPDYYLYFFEKFLKTGEDSKLVEIISRSEEYEVYVKLIIQIINSLYNKRIVLPF